MQRNYDASKLNSHNLFQVYDTRIPRVRQYLDAEINFVRANLTGSETVLELGAGYGRIIKELAPNCASIIGIDISEESVTLGNEYLKDIPNASLVTMDVHSIEINQYFDVVLCLQNGLSAMRVISDTINRIMGLVTPGGSAFFSSYSNKFWNFRLQWFQEQASKGLLGEIDMGQTKNGVIICEDGFRATTHSPENFEEIGKLLRCPFRIEEVDESSVFLIIDKPQFA
jgi:2-polyprenyl-6-hydroxyphenyl methylase/3-demethylubiquinone-9 3-methyltransferase